MGSGAPLVRGVELNKAIDFVFIGRRGDIVPVFSDIQIGLLAKAKALIVLKVLVLRVILMLGRS